MHPKSIILSTLSAIAAISTTNAAVTLQASWALGEAGSVSGTGKQNPLVDSVGTANNITGFQNAANTVSLVTTGLVAPGSTAALQIQQTSASGWHTNSSPFNLSDDWAIQLWVRPDETITNGVLMQTDNSVTGVSVLADGGHFTFAGGASGAANQIDTAITIANGTWYKIDIIRYNGTNNYYVNNALVATGTAQGAFLNAPMLSFGQGGQNGVDAAFDEMKVWTFDHNTDALSAVEAVVAVPEPSIALLGGLGLLGLLRRRRA